MATYKVTARSGLRVRSKPNGTILTAMPYGTTVSGDGKKQGGWYHVKYKGRWGWSYGQYLKTVAEKKKTVASIAAKKKPARKPKTKKANSKKKTDTKKKTDESKNRAKAKGTLGCWGTDLIFEVNSKKILTAKDIKVSQDSRWTKHNILQNVPRGEFSGPDTMGVTLTITLSAWSRRSGRPTGADRWNTWLLEAKSWAPIKWQSQRHRRPGTRSTTRASL